MTIIEAVAKGLFRKNPYSHETQRAVAIAVLTSLKDNVTPEMIHAGDFAEVQRELGLRTTTPQEELPAVGEWAVIRFRHAEIFRAMIEQAIKEIG